MVVVAREGTENFEVEVIHHSGGFPEIRVKKLSARGVDLRLEGTVDVTRGDPGLQGPVAPSAASELAPNSSTTHAATTHHASHSEGTIERMLHTLEFWR